MQPETTQGTTTYISMCRTPSEKFIESYIGLEKAIKSEQFIQISLYARDCYDAINVLNADVHLLMIAKCRAKRICQVMPESIYGRA